MGSSCRAAPTRVRSSKHDATRTDLRALPIYVHALLQIHIYVYIYICVYIHMLYRDTCAHISVNCMYIYIYILRN